MNEIDTIMKIKLRLPFAAIIIFSLVLANCKSDKTSVIEDKIEDEIVDQEEIVQDDYVAKSKFIFYNMYSPIEMSAIFQDAGAIYSPEILNPISVAENYTTSLKIAMNLGLYGVDLSYARMFDQMQVSIEYLAAIQKMAQRLGIPSDFVSFTAAKVEKHLRGRPRIHHRGFRIWRVCSRDELACLHTGLNV